MFAFLYQQVFLPSRYVMPTLLPPLPLQDKNLDSLCKELFASTAKSQKLMLLEPEGHMLFGVGQSEAFPAD